MRPRARSLRRRTRPSRPRVRRFRPSTRSLRPRAGSLRRGSRASPRRAAFLSQNETLLHRDHRRCSQKGLSPRSVVAGFGGTTGAGGGIGPIAGATRGAVREADATGECSDTVRGPEGRATLAGAAADGMAIGFVAGAEETLALGAPGTALGAGAAVLAAALIDATWPLACSTGATGTDGCIREMARKATAATAATPATSPATRSGRRAPPPERPGSLRTTPTTEPIGGAPASPSAVGARGAATAPPGCDRIGGKARPANGRSASPSSATVW